MDLVSIKHMRLAVHFLVFSLLLACCISQKEPVYYCVDDEVLRIFADRLSCLRHNSITQELMLLRSESAAEYSRVHELMAYEYLSIHPPFVICSMLQQNIAELLIAWKQGLIPRLHVFTYTIKNIMNIVKYRKNTVTIYIM